MNPLKTENYMKVWLCVGYYNLSNYGLQKPFASLYWSSKGKADRKPPYLMGKTIFLLHPMTWGLDMISTGWWCQPLWKIWVRQLGWLFPTEWKNKIHVPNHQPGSYMLLYDPTCLGVPQNVLCKRIRRQGDPATEDQHRQGFTPLSS